MEKGEKRNFIRLDSLHLLDYLIIDKEGRQTTYSMGRTLDVSEHGLQLEVTQPMSVGDTLLVTVGIEDDLIDLVGEVKYAKEASKRYTVGIEFSDISDEGLRILKKYIVAFNTHCS
ncbi:PilZ domain-containing protein [Desulfocapsa sulfexigens DSM 10523]|uniref:PilZ domain-containing protein n=2 Tax=Desulfocapsa TaxID=53318 RepID=M1NBW2_DESSD|nr:PilZ domain-containing protein [Desulfocapsa sulfexigens DSM 10523]